MESDEIRKEVTLQATCIQRRP